MADLLSFDQALELTFTHVPPPQNAEAVMLSGAVGRILATEVRARHHLPPVDVSAMDGYAVAESSLDTGPRILPVAGQALCGHPLPSPLAAGNACYIATGAAVPEGADLVIPQERVTRNGETVTLPALSDVKSGQNIRWRGEDVTAEALIVPKGALLTPAHVALFAAQGLTHVTVYTRLKVGVFSTGDELFQPGQDKPAEGIFDSNRQTLLATLIQLGCEAIDLGWGPDDPDHITQKLKDAAAACDVLLTAGGVSVGAADHLPRVLERAGEIIFWRMAVRPGKPVMFGKMAGCPIMALPGNPTAMLIMFATYVRPVLWRAMGRVTPAKAARVRCDFSFQRKAGLRQWLQVRLAEDGSAHLIEKQGPAKMAALTHAEGLVELPEDVAEITPGLALLFIPMF